MISSGYSSQDYSRRTSRASLSALRATLQWYQVPSPGSQSPHTPPRGFHRPHTVQSTSSLDIRAPDSEDLDDLDLREAMEGMAGSGELGSLGMGPEHGLGPEKMDALVEIHRVLYRGKEDLEAVGKQLRWAEQGQEVKRVIERWFESDCGEYIRHPPLR